MAPTPTPTQSPTPEFDLSWLWETLKSIVSTMQDWFAAIWTQAQSIVNTGQGIFTGLVSFGSQLWDAFIKGLDTLGSWIKGAFEWIYNGLKYVSDVFGSWFSNAMAWIGSGLNWLAQQLYNVGNWFYNSILWVWGNIVNTVTTLWQGIVTWFSGLLSTLTSWVESVRTGLNEWFTGMMTGIRGKIKQTVKASITISMAWKAGEKALTPNSLLDIPFGVFGIMFSPIVGAVVAGVVDKVIPYTSTKTFELLPPISILEYTPPTITIPPPVEPTPPELGTPPPLPVPVTGWGLPLDFSADFKSTYDKTWASSDRSAIAESTYDTTVESSDREAAVESTYETAVA